MLDLSLTETPCALMGVIQGELCRILHQGARNLFK